MVKIPTTDEELPTGFVKERTQFLHDYGALIVVWSEFELAIEWKIAQLVGLAPVDASIVLGGLGFGSKCNILYSLLDERGQQSVADKVRAVVSHVQRNALIHGIAGGDRDEGTFAFFKREISNRYVVRHLTYTSEEFTEHFEKFRRLYEEAGNAMGTSIRKLSQFARAAKLLEPTSPRPQAGPGNRANGNASSA